MDNEFDMRLLTSFLEQLFTPNSFDRDFPLTNAPASAPEVAKLLRVPEGTTRAHFLTWIEALPDNSTPIWLGLPDNAEILVSTNKGQYLFNFIPFPSGTITNIDKR